MRTDVSKEMSRFRLPSSGRRRLLLKVPNMEKLKTQVPAMGYVDSCWMKFSIIRKTSLQVQGIWKNGEVSKWLLSPLDQKSFQELVFKAFNTRKCSGCTDRQQVRSIDQNLFFFKLKLLIFRWRWQLWMKTTTQWTLVNIGEYSSWLHLAEYSPMFTSPLASNC